MAGLGNLATTAIITNGLTGGHSPVGNCKHGIVTSAFSLYCSGFALPIEPTVTKTGGGGGGYPGSAWNKFGPGEVQNFYKPVPTEQQYYIVPRDQEAQYFKRRRIVKMVVSIGGKTFDREFSVDENKARFIIKATSVINSTYSNMKIIGANIKRRIHKAKVTITNLRQK